jgi:hypothetical protein
MSQILYAIRKGWLDPNETVTIKSLVEANVIHRPKYGLKLLARVESV